MSALALFFFITALIYAAVGFGGGSTYTALLAINGVDYRILPSIALICNIIVVAGGAWRFGAAGHIDGRRVAPWIALSVPAAFVGGRLEISETVFVGLLGPSLVVAGLQLLFQAAPRTQTTRPTPRAAALAGGGLIGFLSGLVGVGGGIFLAPLLHHLKWDAAKKIAGASALFILANSLSGLLGQFAKISSQDLEVDLARSWPLFLAVLAGGQIGSHLGVLKLDQMLMRRLTALLVLYAAAGLLLRWRDLAT
jgi:hypothetical protein